mgnify:CR=1 FL=1
MFADNSWYFRNALVRANYDDEEVSSDHSSLLDYIPDSTVVQIESPQIDISYKKLVEDILEYKESENTDESFMYELSDLKPNKTISLNIQSSLYQIIITK